MNGAAVVPALIASMLAAGATGADERSARERPMTFLALGDSYTIGEGVAPSERWPMQLAEALRTRGVAIDDPRVIARTGWTTDELSAAIDAEFEGIDEPRFDFATLLVGVNNQYRGRSVEEYAEQFEVLLVRAVAFANGRTDRVMVLAIPDWGVTPFGRQSGRDTAQIARELDAYNAAARKVCARRGVAFVDIAPVSRARGAEPTMLADDGLHPSSDMYSQWTAQAWPVALRLLRAKPR